ncbi:MAG: KOW domain-containing RNA-binding protein [Clostridia bacterium]|nr:KOW domain-containing RNA-binding protein [Clostridia bacterium]
MDTNFVVGDVVQSLSGHDQNRLFIVVGIDKNGFLAIIDGRYREKTKPKLKNPKHLKLVAHGEKLIEKVNSPIVTNAEIYKLIKAYKNIKE